MEHIPGNKIRECADHGPKKGLMIGREKRRKRTNTIFHTGKKKTPFPKERGFLVEISGIEPLTS